jgi:hypothetical protein
LIKVLRLHLGLQVVEGLVEEVVALRSLVGEEVAAVVAAVLVAGEVAEAGEMGSSIPCMGMKTAECVPSQPPV